ncbi:hypothetical protein N9R79_12290 [Vibrio sp.]|nr:hypothetical protein [Vibrio sp.]
MFHINLQLDAEAQLMVGELLVGLDRDGDWFKMMTRFAAQIDSQLKEKGYVGVVKWFSEEDFIEHDITYV